MHTRLEISAPDEDKHNSIIFWYVKGSCLFYNWLSTWPWHFCLSFDSQLSVISKAKSKDWTRSEQVDFPIKVSVSVFLAPLSFYMFISDMYVFMDECTVYNYADDDYLSYITPTIDALISNLHLDCNRVAKCYTDNGTEPNHERFSFIHKDRAWWWFKRLGVDHINYSFTSI